MTRLGAIMGIWGRVKATIQWDRALNMAAASQYNEALDALDKYALNMTEGIEQLLLRGHVLLNLGRAAECISVIEEALQRISASRSRSEMEKRYLSCYAQWRARCAEEFLRAEEPRFSPSYSQVTLDGVPSHIKRKFPLRDHPSWR